MKVEVCCGSKCTMMGADNIINNLEQLKDDILPTMEIKEDFELEVVLINCPGTCKEEENVSPLVIIDGEMVKKASSQTIMARVIDEAKL